LPTSKEALPCNIAKVSAASCPAGGTPKRSRQTRRMVPRLICGESAFWMQTTGAYQVGTSSAGSQRCLRSCIRAVVRPRCCKCPASTRTARFTVAGICSRPWGLGAHYRAIRSRATDCPRGRRGCAESTSGTASTGRGQSLEARSSISGALPLCSTGGGESEATASCWPQIARRAAGTCSGAVTLSVITTFR
jgi:hypothetical protein